MHPVFMICTIDNIRAIPNVETGAIYDLLQKYGIWQNSVESLLQFARECAEICDEHNTDMETLAEAVTCYYTQGCDAWCREYAEYHMGSG